MFANLRSANSKSGSQEDLELNFTSLICSRLCHDLVGPVGAISNGIELMEMEDDLSQAEDALDLLRHSADNAARRLKFLRLAFGSSGGDDMPLPMADAQKAAFDFFEDHRLDLVWPSSLEGAVSKNRIRLGLNLMMAGAAGLMRGGDLAVNLTTTELESHGHPRTGRTVRTGRGRSDRRFAGTDRRGCPNYRMLSGPEAGKRRRSHCSCGTGCRKVLDFRRLSCRHSGM